MSRLFCTFVVRKETNISPPEARTIGKYMLHAEFHIFEQCDCYAFAINLRTILRENGQKDYQISINNKQVVLDIGNLYSYTISFPLITNIEEMRARHQISGYLASLEFQS